MKMKRILGVFLGVILCFTIYNLICHKCANLWGDPTLTQIAQTSTANAILTSVAATQTAAASQTIVAIQTQIAVIATQTAGASATNAAVATANASATNAAVATTTAAYIATLTAQVTGTYVASSYTITPTFTITTTPNTTKTSIAGKWATATASANAVKTAIAGTKTAIVATGTAVAAITATPIVTDTVSIYPAIVGGGQYCSFISITITVKGTYVNGEMYLYTPQGFPKFVSGTVKYGNLSMTASTTGANSGLKIINYGGGAGLTLSAVANDTVVFTYYGITIPASVTNQSFTFVIKDNHYSSVKAATLSQTIANAGLPKVYANSPYSDFVLSSQNPPALTPLPNTIQAFTFIGYFPVSVQAGAVEITRPNIYWNNLAVNGTPQATATPGYIAVAGPTQVVGTKSYTNYGMVIAIPTAGAGQYLTWVFSGNSSLASNLDIWNFYANADSTTLTSELPILGPQYNIVVASPTPVNTIVPYTVVFSATAVSTATITYNSITPPAGMKVKVLSIFMATSSSTGTITVQGGTNSITAAVLNAATNKTPPTFYPNTTYATNEVVQLIYSGITTSASMSVIIVWNAVW